MYIITVSRITSGELLKYRKGFFIQEGYGLSCLGSSQFALTVLLEELRQVADGMVQVDIYISHGVFLIGKETLTERYVRVLGACVE
jgi:hypothetical protein